MTSLPNGFPISLRSWPTKSADATDLPTLFQRIQTERGGFLNISEDSLREEIAKEESGQVVEDESEDEDDTAAEDVKARAVARQELLQQITVAHHSAMNSLNFVSLLLSKANPVAVSQSISPDLRELIPLGTLGATKASNAWISPERKEDNKLVAKGWKSRDVNKSIDSILASATRLENEIQKETVYWEEILSLHDKGWAVSKIPRRKGVMGVRLGSSEATPVLRAQGLAILSRSETGSLQLSSNPITAEPKTLRVRIQIDDEITGISSIPVAISKSANTSSQLLQTRNTLFSMEIWHELNRESRTLGAFNIQSRGDNLLFPLTSKKTAIFDLFPLPETQDVTSSPLRDDREAQGLYLALNLLLSYSHRQAHRRRSVPPKPKPNPKRVNSSGPVHNKQQLLTDTPSLLRPLLTLSNHQTSLTQLHTLFDLLTTALSKAKLSPTPKYNVTTIPAHPPAVFTTAERSLAVLTNHLSAHLSFKILPDTDLKIMLRTSQTSLPTTIFDIQIQPENARLATICPSPGRLMSFDQLEEYILFVTSAALALRFSNNSSNSSHNDTKTTDSPQPSSSEPPSQTIPQGWTPTHHPPTLKFSSPINATPSSTSQHADGKLLTFSLLKITSSPPLPHSTLPSTRTKSQQTKTKTKTGLKLRLTYTYTSDLEANAHEALLDESKLKELIKKRLSLHDNSLLKHKGINIQDSDDGDQEIEMPKMKEDEKFKREGEGFYEWVVWDDYGKRAEDGDGNLEGEGEGDGDVIKSLNDVIDDAAR